MTQTMAEDGNNDMVLGSDGLITFLTGQDASEQLAQGAMETQLGECQLNTTLGVPTLNAVFLNYNPAQFEVAARARIVGVDPSILAVTSFAIEVVDDAAEYETTIETIYGSIAISERLGAPNV